MEKFDLAISKDRNFKVLCIGAHSDDIEIGCGGTNLRLLSEHDNLEVNWIILGAIGQRKVEAVSSANKFLAGAKRKRLFIKNFKESFFPYVGKEIKVFFEEVKKSVSPDIIFTHYRNDLHQDHRLVSELTWNTYRNHFILEYEIIKYDGDLGLPNFFVSLDEGTCRKKINYIMEVFKSQKHRDWFTPDSFYSILRIRGIECRAREKYAEGFHCRKLVI